MIDQLPQWFQIFFLSMVPGIESRYVIPYAMFTFGYSWHDIFPVAIVGNMVLVPFGLLFFKYLEIFLRRFQWSSKLIDKLFLKIRKRADDIIRKYERLALLIVAIPLPFTGAGLGVLIAYLFDLPFKRSIVMIFIGIVISSSITTFIFLSGR